MLAEKSFVFGDELLFGRRSENGTELENQADGCNQALDSNSLQGDSPCLSVFERHFSAGPQNAPAGLFIRDWPSQMASEINSELTISSGLLMM